MAAADVIRARISKKRRYVRQFLLQPQARLGKGSQLTGSVVLLFLELGNGVAHALHGANLLPCGFA